MRCIAHFGLLLVLVLLVLLLLLLLLLLPLVGLLGLLGQWLGQRLLVGGDSVVRPLALGHAADGRERSESEICEDQVCGHGFPT